MGGSAAPSEAVQPGTPVNLAIPADATGLTVTRPDGSVMELVPQSAESRSVAFSATGQLGIYLVTPHLASGGSAAPSSQGSSSGAASPAAIPSARSSPPTASAGAGSSATPSRAPVDPNAPVRFAVDLFDVGESTISPGSAATIEALGRAPAASPGAGSGGGSAATERPTAREELWIPIALIVLVALCVEWAVYQRDAVVRLRRGLASRFGRRPSDGSA
jgi:hypothetical protein